MTPRNEDNSTSKGSSIPVSATPTTAKVPASMSSPKLHVVLDIDETLVAGPVVQSEEELERIIKALRENQVHEPIIVTRHQSLIFIHIVHRGVFEFLRYLFQGLGAKVSFFSAAIKERNEKLVPDLLTQVFGSEYEKITGKVDVYSRDDLDKEENVINPTKNLRKILKEEKDFSNTVLVDNDAFRVSKGLQANAIIALGPKKWQDFVGGEIVVFMRLNNIFYITGVLDAALQKQNGKSLSENLQELTFSGNTRISSLDERSIQYYHHGLLVLQKYKPALQFYIQSQVVVKTESKLDSPMIFNRERKSDPANANANANADVMLENTVDEQKIKLKQMRFGCVHLKNPKSKDLNDGYRHKPLWIAVDIWNKRFNTKTDITKEEFRDACYHYLDENALCDDRDYLKGLSKHHLERLYDIYSWTRYETAVGKEYRMRLTQFCHVFLFLGLENHLLNNKISLADTIDALHKEKNNLSRLKFLSRFTAEDQAFTQPVITLGEGAVERVEDKQSERGFRVINHGLCAYLHVHQSDPFPLLYTTPIEVEGKSRVGFTSRNGQVVHNDLIHLDNLIEELKTNKFTAPNVFLPQLIYVAPALKMTEVKKEVVKLESIETKSVILTEPPKPVSELILNISPEPKNNATKNPESSTTPTVNRNLRYGAMFARSLQILRTQVTVVNPTKKAS